RHETDRLTLTWTLRRLEPGRPGDVAALVDGLWDDGRRRDALRALYALGLGAAGAAPGGAAFMQTLPPRAAKSRPAAPPPGRRRGRRWPSWAHGLQRRRLPACRRWGTRCPATGCGC